MQVDRSTARWSGGGASVSLHRVGIVSDAPGPVVVITGNLHGDETTGLGAALRLVERLPSVLRAGQVHVFPSLNPLGLLEQSRGFGQSGADLNRCFPGAGDGDLTHRYAHFLWEQLTALRPDVLIDLHADSLESMPYVIVDRPVRQVGEARRTLSDRLDHLAQATGLTVIRDYPAADYRRYGLDRSLSGAVVNLLGLPALTIESGPRGALDSQAEQRSEQAVLRLLSTLGLATSFPAEPLALPVSGRWCRALGPRSRHAGVVRPHWRPGTPFAAGALLATIYDLDGQPVEAIRSSQDGLLVAWGARSWVRAGQSVATIATREEP